MKQTIKMAALSAMVAFAGCSSQPEPKGIDKANMDLTANPGDDFNQYSNGGWMANNAIPGDKARFGAFDVLGDESEKKVKELVEETTKGEQNNEIAKKIGMFYSLGLNSEKVNAEGFQPIQPLLDDISAIKNTNDITNIVASFHLKDISAIFSLFPTQDAKNSEMVIAQVNQGGLGLTDRDYYFAQGERGDKLRAAYIQMVEKGFQLIGNNPETATKNASTVMAIETALAEVSMTRLEERDPHATYNKLSLVDLQKLAPEFNWTSYFQIIGINDVIELNVAQLKFAEGFNKMLKSVSIDDWKTYLQWKVINNTSGYLSDEFVDNSFNFYGKELMGAQENRPRWKRVLSNTNGALGEAIGQLFVAKYFPPQAKERMIKLVDNLKTSFAARINNLDWMSNETKVKAKDKLQSIVVKIGYPDEWRDYSALEVKEDSYLMNVLRANEFNNRYYYAQIGKPVNRKEWGMTPQTVNAYYNPGMNEIVFPAAILQPPFFNMEADDAVNYGAIGVVIGHEMTHGFDDQGAKYDKFGNLETWWSAEDTERFNERTQVLVNQFNNYVVLDTLRADGQLSLGENIADLGGLNIALEAFYLTEQFKQNKGYNDFTPVQRFFLAYSHIWAQNIRDAEIVRRTKEDVHSLGRLRVNGPLPNMPEFVKAFDIKETDKMFIPTESRAKIW